MSHLPGSRESVTYTVTRRCCTTSGKIERQAAPGSSMSRKRIKALFFTRLLEFACYLCLPGCFLFWSRGEHKRKRMRCCRHFSRKKCCATWTNGVQGAQSRLSFSLAFGDVAELEDGPREISASLGRRLRCITTRIRLPQTEMLIKELLAYAFAKERPVTQTQMHKAAFRKRFAPVQVPFVLSSMLLFVFLIAPQPAKAWQWSLKVGAESHSEANQADAFLPNEIWIYEGDSILWTWQPKNEPHTLTLLMPTQTRPTPPPPIGPPSGPPIGPPFYFGSQCPSPNPHNGGSATFDGSACVSSAALFGGTPPSTFTVTFPKAGNYKFVCLIHTNMQGTVHVLSMNPASPFYAASLPLTQADYDKQASDEAEDVLKDADNPNEEVKDFARSENEVIMTGEVVATGGGRQYLAIVRFFPETIHINKGETVEFTNVDPTEPHTITSGSSDTLVNDMATVNAKAEADGALGATVNSAAGFGNATPTTGVHSGFLQAAPEDAAGRGQSPPGATRFRVTFNVAGTFPYHCALHDVDGMAGTVVVK
jgi:plastocyanin